MTIHIDIIDRSGKGSKYDWEKMAHACETQVRLNVSPYWSVGNSAFVEMRDAPVPGHWPVLLLDQSDVDGALGYHTADDNNPILPVGKVFVGTDEKYGLLPSVTLSHEIVEIVGDPMAQLAFQATATEFWALELCDAVEADRFAYELEGVMVSDFVTPAWFYGGPGRYSYRKTVSAPRTLAPGGYQAYWNGRTWTQRYADAAPGVVSRALTMGRSSSRRELQAWAEALEARG